MPHLQVDNPATGELVVELELQTPSAAARAIERAVAASRALKTHRVAERVRIGEGVCRWFDAHRAETAEEITLQMGKPIAEARREVDTMLERARFLLAAAPEALRPIELESPATLRRVIERVPVGVVLDIAAWNYPLLIAVNVVLPAFLAGNAVLLKHASRTPLCAARFERAFDEAGAPPGAVQALYASHDTIAGVIANPAIGYVAFTGSVEGGRAVRRAAAARFIDIGLELGGKDAAYVRADVDIEAVAAEIADGAFYNAGQSCCAVERIYVDRRIHAAFRDALVAEAAKRTPGDPTDPNTCLGAIAESAGLATIERHVADAVAAGARVLAGGRRARVEGGGRFYEATVIDGAHHAMAVMSEETFGPVAPIQVVDGDDQAVERINDCRYGLTASIWTGDLDRAKWLSERLEVGTVYTNRCDYLDPELPWAGWKESGVGLTLSRFAFDRLVRTRSLYQRRLDDSA